MTRRLAAAALALALMASACTNAPDPGNLAAFCGLLGQGVGLSTTADESEYARLSLVAPPEISPTIESLQTQARDFDELLNVDPPDLATIFTAKFDPEAERDRAELDRYAASGCDLEIERPPFTRWATFVRENHANAAWRDGVIVGFEVSASGEELTAATISFANVAEQMTLVEQVCNAMAEFLIGDGAEGAAITVIMTDVVVLEQSTANGPCRLP